VRFVHLVWSGKTPGVYPGFQPTNVTLKPAGEEERDKYYAVVA
jgi:hypothetical protein